MHYAEQTIPLHLLQNLNELNFNDCLKIITRGSYENFLINFYQQTINNFLLRNINNFYNKLVAQILTFKVEVLPYIREFFISEEHFEANKISIPSKW